MQTTSQRSRVAGRSATLAGCSPSLSLPALPSGMSPVDWLVARDSRGTIFLQTVAGEGRAGCPASSVWEREASPASGPHKTPAHGVTRALASAPYTTGHFLLGALDGEVGASSASGKGGATPKGHVCGRGSGLGRPPRTGIWDPLTPPTQACWLWGPGFSLLLVGYREGAPFMLLVLGTHRPTEAESWPERPTIRQPSTKHQLCARLPLA